MSSVLLAVLVRVRFLHQGIKTSMILKTTTIRIYTTIKIPYDNNTLLARSLGQG